MTNHFDTTDLEALRQQIAAAKMLTVTCTPSWELVDTLMDRLRKDSQPSAMVSREAIEDCILDAIREATGEDPSMDDDADAWLFSTKIHALQLHQPVAPVQGGGAGGALAWLDHLEGAIERRDAKARNYAIERLRFNLAHLQAHDEPPKQTGAVGVDAIKILQSLASMSEGGIIGQHLSDFPGLVGRRIRQALAHLTITQSAPVVDARIEREGPIMNDPCREAFEKKWESSNERSRRHELSFADRDTAWKAWQAAWNTRPVAEVPSQIECIEMLEKP